MSHNYHMLAAPIRKAGRLLIGAAFSSLLLTLGACSGATSSPQSPSAAPQMRSIAVGVCVTPPPGLLDCSGSPPAGDPSALTGPFIGLQFAQDLLATLPPANEGAFVGGPSGTFRDAGINNVIQKAQLVALNIPTNKRPSPLFGAQEFTQQMMRTEELGRQPLDPSAPLPTMPFPQPSIGPEPEQDPTSVFASGPSGADLDAFLSQTGLAPFPTVFSNTIDQNPWKSDIEAFLGSQPAEVQDVLSVRRAFRGRGATFLI